MTVQELVARFPEIPKDLHEEPILSRFVLAGSSGAFREVVRRFIVAEVASHADEWEAARAIRHLGDHARDHLPHPHRQSR